MFLANMAPNHLIFDEDQDVLLLVMQYIYKRFGIIIKISPYNHGILKTGRHTRSISGMMANIPLVQDICGHIIFKLLPMHIIAQYYMVLVPFN